MTTLISLMLATLLFGGHMLYTFLQRKKTVEVLPVEAGPTANASEDFPTPVRIRVGKMPMDASLKYFVVRNECMIPRHIYSGDLIGVQLLNDNFTISQIKKDDILLIRLDDERFRGHKIRVMDHVGDDVFHTYYFVGKRQQASSEPHAFSTILGVVREVNHMRPGVE